MLRTAETPRLASSDPWQAALSACDTTDLNSAADSISSERVDTKFVLSDDAVLSVIESLSDDYNVLDVDGSRFTHYRTRYFDTESYAMFRKHHVGRSNRYKVRTRLYSNTGIAYVEIKRKNPRGATSKLRKRIPDFATMLSGEAAAFVDAHCAYPSASLQLALCNSFDRIFLIGRHRRERLTIDLDIGIDTTEGRIPLAGVAVAELKQERHSNSHNDSPFHRKMREMHIRSSGFSKYCMGLLLTQPTIKHNLFKPQLRKLQRLMGELNVV